ncbi:MAG TPA: FKBP-type peptidyl-prolyl cis-trans isomerase, partial [Bacteroidales bacterium]|nr:FKBP-type peptidyl-prolyl cis-trans isomerase [Bacteroidales bacterium]
MKKSFMKPLAVLLLLAVTFMACSSKYPGFDKTSTGLYYKLYKVGSDTVKPKNGDWISLHYKMSGVSKGKDTLLFESKKQSPDAIRMQLPASDYKGDIYEGLRMLSAGDSATFLINADSLFRKTFRQGMRPRFIDTNSMVTFSVHVLTVDKPEALKKKEQDDLQAYLKTNNVTVQPTASGVYYIEKTAGSGIKIDTGCQVKLHFKVSLINGKQIFSSFERPDPIQFSYGKRFDTPGLNEAIGLMKKGTKATVIVPSSM